MRRRIRRQSAAMVTVGTRYPYPGRNAARRTRHLFQHLGGMVTDRSPKRPSRQPKTDNPDARHSPRRAACFLFCKVSGALPDNDACRAHPDSLRPRAVRRGGEDRAPFKEWEHGGRAVKTRLAAPVCTVPRCITTMKNRHGQGPSRGPASMCHRVFAVYAESGRS